MAAHSWMPGSVAGWPPAVGLHNRLLGFVKTVLLRQLVTPGSVVCDLFCGRGLDTERWADAAIGRYIGVDLSASALEEAKEQWEQHEKPFAADFCELDPCMVDLEAHLQEYGLPADVVCCLAHLQDSFTSEDMVRRLLKNIAAVLRPGGFFFGTAPDSSTIWYKYQKAVEGAMKAGSLRVNGTLPSVRSELYKISFDDDRFHSFGSKYFLRFTDDGLPAQAQILVHFPSLIRLAKEVGLECVEIQNLQEFYEDTHGPFADVLQSSCASLVDTKGTPILDVRGRLNAQAVDVLSLYTTIVFKKREAPTRFFRPSPKAEDPSKTSVAEIPLSVYSRRKDDHVPVQTEWKIFTRRIDHSKWDEKPRENGNQATDHSEDHTENGAHSVMWHKDAHGVTEGVQESGLGRERQDNHDLPDSSSEYRPHGLKQNSKDKYYTRSGSRGHQSADAENGHHVVKGLKGSEFKTWPSKEASTSGNAGISAEQMEKT